MTEMKVLGGTVLVAVDFSPSSLRALDAAFTLAGEGGEVTVLHVIDTRFVGRCDQMGLGDYDGLVVRLRAQAEEEIACLAKERARPFESMVVFGTPFAEIVKIARDLDVNAVVIGMHGASRTLEDALFGGTAEKVLRAARCPVLCVP